MTAQGIKTELQFYELLTGIQGVIMALKLGGCNQSSFEFWNSKETPSKGDGQ